MIALELPKNHFNILLIEDNQGDQILAQKRLEKGFEKASITCFFASNLEAGKKIVATTPIHVILLDLNLPDSSGLQSVKDLKKSFPETSLIVLTGWDDRKTAIESLHLGAQDYLIKGSYTASSLAWSIRSAITRQENLNEIEKLKKTDKQRLEFKDRILSMAAHDIRGSLVGVLGFLKNIVNGELIDDLRPDQKRIFELMLKNCENVVGLSDEIVRARREHLVEINVSRRSLDVQKFLESIKAELETNCVPKNISIIIETTFRDDCFDLDGSLLSRALKNLLLNAVEHSPENSEIRLKAETDQNNHLVFRIKDSGNGIEDEKISKLFEEVRPFDPKDPHSCYHGLGLVIVKRIVTAHGGEIGVTSGVGIGTEFEIRIPPIPEKFKSETRC